MVKISAFCGRRSVAEESAGTMEKRVYYISVDSESTVRRIAAHHLEQALPCRECVPGAFSGQWKGLSVFVFCGGWTPPPGLSDGVYIGECESLSPEYALGTLVLAAPPGGMGMINNALYVALGAGTQTIRAHLEIDILSRPASDFFFEADARGDKPCALLTVTSEKYSGRKLTPLETPRLLENATVLALDTFCVL